MTNSWLPAVTPAAATLVCIAMLATGCSNGHGGDAQTSPPPALAQSAQTSLDAQSVASTVSDAASPQPDSPVAPTDSAVATASVAPAVAADPAATPASNSPVSSAADSPATAAAGTCTLVASNQVERVMHLGVQSVEATDKGCTFHFKGGDHGDIVVAYAAQGGHDELDSVHKAAEGARAIFGGIARAASAPPAAMGLMSATPPPDVAKVGDDQLFVTEGPVTQFYATKGDAYVEVDGGFLPEGVSRWIALPEIARRVLAGR